MDPLERDIKAAEGCELTAYRDTLGFWTAGYGHLLPNQQTHDYTGFTITQQMADVWLEQDIGGATQAARNLPEWLHCDTICRKNALIELVFNMGGKWRQFAKCRAAIQREDWGTSARELLDSVWATQVGPIRANRLAGYLLNGHYP